MIVYDPLWKTLKERGITAYALITKYGYSSHTIYRLRHNSGISTSLINELCTLLECDVSDILQFIPDDKKEEKC